MTEPTATRKRPSVRSIPTEPRDVTAASGSPRPLQRPNSEPRPGGPPRGPAEHTLEGHPRGVLLPSRPTEEVATLTAPPVGAGGSTDHPPPSSYDSREDWTQPFLQLRTHMSRTHEEFQLQLGQLQEGLREVKGQYETTVTTIKGLGDQMEASAVAQTRTFTQLGAITQLLTARTVPDQVAQAPTTDDGEAMQARVRCCFAKWARSLPERQPTPPEAVPPASRLSPRESGTPAAIP